MLIPESAARIAFYSRMLYGNKQKGEAFLSNLIYINDWALQAIDERIRAIKILLHKRLKYGIIILQKGTSA